MGSECQDPYISSRKQERADRSFCRAEKDLLKLDFLCFLLFFFHHQNNISPRSEYLFARLFELFSSNISVVSLYETQLEAQLSIECREYLSAAGDSRRVSSPPVTSIARRSIWSSPRKMPPSASLEWATWAKCMPSD